MAYMNLAGVANSKTLEMACFQQTSNTFQQTSNTFQQTSNTFQTVLRSWSVEDDRNNVIKLLKMVDDLKIKDVSILLRQELMRKKSECGCQKCIDFSYKELQGLPFEKKSQDFSDSDKPDIYEKRPLLRQSKLQAFLLYFGSKQTRECMQEQLKFFEMDEDICQEVCLKMLDNYKVELKHMRLGEKMNITIEDMMNSQTTYNSFETLIRCWINICDCGEFSMKALEDSEQQSQQISDHNQDNDSQGIMELQINPQKFIEEQVLDSNDHDNFNINELQMELSINSEEKVEHCSDDEDSKINELYLEPLISGQEQSQYFINNQNAKIDGNNDVRMTYVNLAGVVDSESLEMARLEQSPKTVLRHWSAEDGKNNVIKLLKIMDDLKIKDVSILLREELMKKKSECGCRKCIDFFHYKDCLQEQLKFFDMNPNICNQICTKMVGNTKFEMTHERIAEIMNLATGNMRKFKTSYDLLETFMRCWSAEDDKNNVIKLLKIVDDLKIEDISALLRHELMKKKAQCDCQKCIDFSYKEFQWLSFEKKSQDFNGSDNLDIYECMQEQLRFFEMDEDICQEVCSKILDNYKVEMKHMRLGEEINITIEDMMNSQTTYNSFETLIRCWMDICDCGEFSMEELQSEPLTNCEEKVLDCNGHENPENNDSIDLTVGVGIENVDEKKFEDFNGCGNAKFNAISSNPLEVLNVESLKPSPEKKFPKWKCTDESTKHRKLLQKLTEYGRNPNVKIENVGDVRVIFSDEFCIGKGNNETRVYLGLRKDGFGKAVKRIRRDNCLNDALQEKKILNDFNAKKSRYVVNYYNIEDEIGSEYVYLILDLCEESLENFVKSSSQSDLQKALPEILKQILKGLADLHSGVEPIIHRDLKPSNVLRDSQSEFLLADFGISRILKNDSKTHKSKGNMGTEDWIAPESYCEDNDSVDKGRYKKESDVYNAGMVAYYVATKGKHPFGNKPERLMNMLNGKPVGLDKIRDETLKDFLSWMLNRQPEDRPSATKALKHPFFMSDDEKFDFLCKVGNQQPIKTRDTKSSVVKQLNSKYSNWKSFIDTDVYDYLRTDEVKRKMFKYGPSLTEFLRLIRNIGQHWYDRPRPRPQPEPFYKIGDHKAFFLKTFPNLPVWVHAAVRSDEEFKNYSELKNFFNESKPHQ
ncbi:uncharacterized protein LOC124448160 isoform X2 [Xenia sp. Carnegie-2017]|uniref:uncharacterized protein LOC124448160 isoform X2 n=1 Tax=Xenia sp. Carnegie-2017 TaxID=2897299 RepID=UPI001F046376|nr:uncharacterized protein LOC124448160 isoform X2 [Xenia sp. Carnegie-2017]